MMYRAADGTTVPKPKQLTADEKKKLMTTFYIIAVIVVVAMAVLGFAISKYAMKQEGTSVYMYAVGSAILGLILAAIYYFTMIKSKVADEKVPVPAVDGQQPASSGKNYRHEKKQHAVDDEHVQQITLNDMMNPDY